MRCSTSPALTGPRAHDHTPRRHPVKLAVARADMSALWRKDFACSRELRASSDSPDGSATRVTSASDAGFPSLSTTFTTTPWLRILQHDLCQWLVVTPSELENDGIGNALRKL